MRKRKKIVLLILVMVGLTMWSCEKEKSDIDITSNSWEVVKIKKQGKHTYTKVKETYVLEFINDSVYTLKLDVNDCEGNYTAGGDGKINIESMACTEICCDSELAEDLVRLLPEMTDYYGIDQELILAGEGEIILKQH